MAEAIRSIRRNIQVKDRVLTGGFERVHRQANIREPVGQFLRAFRDVDEFFKPIETDSHPLEFERGL